MPAMRAAEIELTLPRSLTTIGQGTVSFTVEIVGNRYRSWDRVCRVENLGDAGDFRFQQGGIAAVAIPGELVGRLLLGLHFEEPRSGRRLTGSCPLEIRRYGDLKVHIDARGQEAGDGVIYQPIEVSDSDSAALAIVEGEVRLPVVLHDEPLRGTLPLSVLTSRQRLVRLRQREGGVARMLSLHVGAAAVVGRCYASQLRPEARRRLEAAGQSKVHWVTHWDDPQINQISALLRFRSAGDEPRLEVSNLTDYSSAGQTLELARDSGEFRRVDAGADCEISLDEGRVLQLAVGEGVRRRELVRFIHEEVAVGGVACPLIRTERAVFPFPPDTEDARLVRFLGAWLPIKLGDLRDLLDLEESELTIRFPDQELRLALAYDPHRRQVTVASNEDLTRGLD